VSAGGIDGAFPGWVGSVSLRVLQSLAEGAGVPGLDQPQVIDPGWGRRRCVGVRFGVDVPADLERHGLPDRSAVMTGRRCR
jgi:hypothetical protein